MAGEAIFIGYRREDTADVAGRIFDALAGRFGKARVFKDVDNIGPGVEFGDYIKSVLPRCRVALILIGPSWLSVVDDSGRRRIDDENDWVRVEIEIALASPHLLVVPILVNGAVMPPARQLPESLRPLVRRNAAIIRRDPDFHGDVERLARAIRASMSSGALDLSALGGDVFADGAKSRASMLVRGAMALVAASIAIGGAALWRARSEISSDEAAKSAAPADTGLPLETETSQPSSNNTAEEGERLDAIRAMLAPVSLAGAAPSEQLLQDYEQHASPYVFFDFDQAVLRPEAQAALDQQARWLIAHPQARARVYGNADERESDDAVMLGARRARAVRDYLIGAGVPGEQVGSTTFGLLEPLANQRDEAAWAMNRRVETRLVSVAAP